LLVQGLVQHALWPMPIRPTTPLNGLRVTQSNDATLWLEWVFAIPGYKPAFAKLARPFRSLLLHALAPAA
jgi:hypothetical protein